MSQDPAVSTALDAAERHLDALADALHDGPVQSLVVARYAADAAMRGGDTSLTREAVQQALVELRLALWSLRPRGATGLADALSQLSAHLGSTVVLDGDASGLSASCATSAYRLVQALAAVDAAPVHVAVRREAGLLELTVTGGGPLADADGWAARARAHGGDLRRAAGAVVLTLPLATLPAPRLPDPEARVRSSDTNDKKAAL